MDSNRKFQEDQENIDSIAVKIAKELYRYEVRLTSASYEVQEVTFFKNKQPKFSDLWRASNRKLLELQEEINVCNSQIRAYKENDNKAKLIPDRLL